MNEPWVGLIAAIALAIVAWFLGGRRKSDADTTETITNAAAHMIDQLRQELQRLTLEIDNMRRENTSLTQQVKNLTGENERLAAAVLRLERQLAERP